MVGYVYSFDFERGYNYILIEAYDEDFLELIGEGSECDLYSVDRADGSFVYAKPRELISKLGLRRIKDITKLIAESEADDAYPVKISWEIIPGGNVNKRSAEDMTRVWYVPTEVLDTGLSYININDFCFDYEPARLEASFCVHVLRQVCSLCGIYADDSFADCGARVFCSSYMAHYEKELFGTEILYNKFKAMLPLPEIQRKITKAEISTALADIPTVADEPCRNPLSRIIKTERKAVTKLARILKSVLDSSGSIEDLSKMIRAAIKESCAELPDIEDEFIKTTHCSRADMRFMSLTELHDVFAFADKALTAANLVRVNRRRMAYHKKMSAPTILHKGKLY